MKLGGWIYYNLKVLQAVKVEGIKMSDMEMLDKNTSIIGFVDYFDGNTIFGWAHDPESNQALEIKVLINGEEVKSAIAEQFREDLKQAGYNSGLCAFEILR